MWAQFTADKGVMKLALLKPLVDTFNKNLTTKGAMASTFMNTNSVVFVSLVNACSLLPPRNS